MAKIIIDNQSIDCRDGIPVLQAALEAGWDVPHYCYHPGLSVVASCRLCLMEMKMPHPKTHEMGWVPKLFPSCQTPVKDGMEVRFDSTKVRENQQDCMEYFLLNHPLDCPVCDQAGECYLQDYSFKFGHATSRMVEQKLKNPKKDIGPRTLLYQDRCVMCSRCVRFADEVSGTHELCIVNRGARAEIDVFPGLPLDNALQGNVVDICPVGSLLDKDFLFKQRVWHLKSANSVCPGCSTGCAIHVNHNDNVVYRLKPRYNPGVNDWWMCDEGRFGFQYVHDRTRIARPRIRRGSEAEYPEWEVVADTVTYRFARQVEEHPDKKVAAVLSPMMACEEAWLLATFVRRVAPEALLVPGWVPMKGDDQRFPMGCMDGQVKFTIRQEKCPNRRGVDAVIDGLGGPTCDFDTFVRQAQEGAFSSAWIVGGYPAPWVTKECVKAADKLDLLVVQDMFENELTAAAAVVLPACAWVERDGSFINATDRLQPFERAVDPPDGSRRDGQYLFELAGFEGLYTGERVRKLMSEGISRFGSLDVAPELAPHQH